MSRVIQWTGVFLLIIGSMLGFYAINPFVPTARADIPTQASAVIPEGTDFSTVILRDPWDMSEFNDISQYLNRSGQDHLLDNIQVENGIFAATTQKTNAVFTPLLPGYNPATTFLDGDGGKSPIPAASFHCLYIAMKVHSGPIVQDAHDWFQISWYKDAALNLQETGIASELVHPEYANAAPGTQPVNNWKLYRVDLQSPSFAVSGIPWNALAAWQGLMIHPVNKAQVRFEVDWVRLTNCTPNSQRITWTPDPNVNALWLYSHTTNNAIRVAPTTQTPLTGIDGNAGFYDLDTQGIAPGTYSVGVGTLEQPPVYDSQWVTTLTINQTPIVTFDKPSYTSGEDYATTTVGNAWDFTDASDVTGIAPEGIPASYSNAMLHLITASGPLPAGIDSQVWLNGPQTHPINGSDYRYLTFQMSTTWTGKISPYTNSVPWANGPGGMIARWIWYIPGVSGTPGNLCALVGDDIPYDIGWQTYTVDLHNDLAGQVEEMQGDCPAHRSHINWQTSNNIAILRFDPNENITEAVDTITGGGPFYQSLAEIKLTKVDQATQGTPYPIQLSLNKTLPSDYITLYYTTNPQQWNQYPVAYASAPSGTTFYWDTSGVPVGTYYICAVAQDGYNSSPYCSKAPVNVVAAAANPTPTPTPTQAPQPGPQPGPQPEPQPGNALKRNGVHNDYNNDGYADILLRHNSGMTYMYLMNGKTLIGHGLVAQDNDPNWRIIATGDYNNDGYSDILLRHSAGYTYMYLMQNTTMLDLGLITQDGDSGWSSFASGDYNGDGYSDILMMHNSGMSYVYLMQGKTIIGQQQLNWQESGWSIVGSGDYNQDGVADALMRHTNGNVGFLLNMLSTPQLVTFPLDTNWRIVGDGDYNGDGSSDLLFQHTTGPTYAYLMQGMSVIDQGYFWQGNDPSWSVVASGDYNADGYSDVLFRHNGGITYMHLMQGKTIIDQGVVAQDNDPNWSIAAGVSTDATELASNTTATIPDKESYRAPLSSNTTSESPMQPAISSLLTEGDSDETIQYPTNQGKQHPAITPPLLMLPGLSEQPHVSPTSQPAYNTRNERYYRVYLPVVERHAH
jgi:predicted NUDIX family NTP pyrophosphohydrolase